MYKLKIKVRKDGYYDIILFQDGEVYLTKRRLDYAELNKNSRTLAFYFQAKIEQEG